MPNQYNAAKLTPETYPYTVGAHSTSGVFPNSVSTNLVAPPGSGAAITEYKDVGLVDDGTTRSPQPSASGVGGENSVSLTGAFDGGVGADKVVDHVETKGFTSNVDPNEPGGLRWGEV
jgi:hypothetical protein